MKRSVTRGPSLGMLLLSSVGIANIGNSTHPENFYGIVNAHEKGFVHAHEI